MSITYPGIYNWLLIKRHLLTFSYTAGHLPLEFTVGVLPPLFLWEQHQIILTTHPQFTWTTKITSMKKGFPVSGECGVTYCSIHISRWIAVGVCQHGDNTNHDCLYCVDRKPAFLRLFITKLILSRLMQNWNANVPVLCHCEEWEHIFNSILYKSKKVFSTIKLKAWIIYFKVQARRWQLIFKVSKHKTLCSMCVYHLGARFQLWTSSLEVVVDNHRERWGMLWKTLLHCN